MEAGDRSLREKQHQSIWEAGNPNKAKEGRLCSKEKDEEVIEYFMEDRYVHANPRITNLNSTIVKKVNVMQNLMFEYDEETAVEADDSMRKMTLKSLSNLHNQITKLQEKVRIQGGLPYPIPEVLDKFQ